MSDWKEYTLEELCDFQNGFAFKNSDYVDSSENTNEVFRMGYINRGGGFKEDTTPVFVPQNYPKNLDKFILKLNDITIAMTDMKNSMALLGCCARISHNNRFVLNQRVGRIRVVRNDILDPIYLYYYLNSSKQIDYLRANANSGVQVNLSTDTIKKSILKIPSIEKQREIANILFALDQKIELNTQINQTLEQIAQALFKSWFVDFDPMRAKVQALSDGLSLEQAELAAMQAISGKTPEELTALLQEQPDRYAELAETAKAFPCEMVKVDGGEVPKGWEQTTLSDICEMQNGYAFKSSDWMEQGIPVIKIGSVKPMIVEVEGNGFVSEDYSKLKPDFLLKSGDILVGLTGYVGEVGRIPTGKIAMLNQRVAKFLPKEIDKNHCFYNYIYCLARQSQFKEFAEMNAKGSAQANISTKELLKFPIIKANDELHIFFENRVKELLESILWNSQNSETLAKTRDLLLPRLLDGSI